jgi:endonuclease/exonuclease/phosphatase family metal-dependent hydrolase
MSQILKVATYNIRKCIGNDRKRNPHRTLEVLNEIDADIIALQEADRRFGTRESCLSLELLASSSAWEAAPLDVRPQSIGWHGNAILLRRGIKMRHAAPLHLPMLEPRGAVVAELTVNGRDVRVIGVHLDLSGLWRRRQVRWLLAYLDAQPRHMPTIIMGDFNQWSDRGGIVRICVSSSSHFKDPQKLSRDPAGCPIRPDYRQPRCWCVGFWRACLASGATCIGPSTDLGRIDAALDA